MPQRIEKLREADPKELEVQQHELNDQIFRLKFQLSTGQAEAVKRLREAKKDLARIKTLLRARELSAAAPPQETSAAGQPQRTRTSK